MGAQELASAVAYYSYGGYYGNGPSLLWVTAAVLVFLIVAFVYFSLRVQRKRALRRRWAEGCGLAFHRSDESLGEATGRVYSLMGGSHVARDVVAIPTPFGDALYYELASRPAGSSGMSEFRHSLLRYPLPASLPRMRIKSWRMTHELASGAGARGRSFRIKTEWRAFNEEFDVKSVDEEAARALLTPAMQEFLMARMRETHMEIVGDVAYLMHSKYSSVNSPAYAALMGEWTARVPSSLFSKHGALRPGGESGQG